MVPDDSHSSALDSQSLEALLALAGDELAPLGRIATVKSFAAGETVYEEAAVGTDFLLVVAGELEARRRTPFGDQRVAMLRPGDICGEISLLDGKPRSSGVVGLSAGRLLRFGAPDVAALAAAQPEVDVALLRMFCRTLAGKIRQANMVMTEIMAPGATADPRGKGSKGEESDLDQESKRRLLAEQGMASAELQALSAFLKAERFASGEPIFREGEADDTLYIVAEGQVRISRRIPGLGDEAIAILGRGEVFGEMAWIDSSPRSADAVAHTGGCTVLGISRHHLDGTLGTDAASSAQFLKVVCQVLCRRLRAMNDQLVAYRTIAWF